MKTALLIVDMQKEMEFRVADGRDTVNPFAGQVIGELAEAFRVQGFPVIHVRHNDRDPASPFHEGKPSAEPMDCDGAAPGEAIFVKTTSSAFASTDLAAHLRDKAIGRLVVTGAVAAFCVTSAVRSASDLGFEVWLAENAVMGFDLPDGKGGLIAARPLFDATMAILGADFARIVAAETVLSELRIPADTA